MKVFKSKFNDKLVRTDNPTCKEGFKALLAGNGELLLVCEEGTGVFQGRHTRIVLSRQNVKQLKKQIKAVEKALGWTK